MYKTIHSYLRIYNGGSGIRETLTALFPAKWKAGIQLKISPACAVMMSM